MGKQNPRMMAPSIPLLFWLDFGDDSVIFSFPKNETIAASLL
jgi:hypothetical protein